MAVFITFGAILVNSMENDAGVFFGENVQTGWDSHAKNNMGLGQVFGNGDLIISPLNIFSDCDIIDAPINDQDVEANLGPAIAKIT
jgi:hypothetical protein